LKNIYTKFIQSLIYKKGIAQHNKEVHMSQNIVKVEPTDHIFPYLAALENFLNKEPAFGEIQDIYNRASGRVDKLWKETLLQLAGLSLQNVAKLKSEGVVIISLKNFLINNIPKQDAPPSRFGSLYSDTAEKLERLWQDTSFCLTERIANFNALWSYDRAISHAVGQLVDKANAFYYCMRELYNQSGINDSLRESFADYLKEDSTFYDRLPPIGSALIESAQENGSFLSALDQHFTARTKLRMKCVLVDWHTRKKIKVIFEPWDAYRNDLNTLVSAYKQIVKFCQSENLDTLFPQYLSVCEQLLQKVRTCSIWV